jgi:hypothetical protein
MANLGSYVIGDPGQMVTKCLQIIAQHAQAHCSDTDFGVTFAINGPNTWNYHWISATLEYDQGNDPVSDEIDLYIGWDAYPTLQFVQSNIWSAFPGINGITMLDCSQPGLVSLDHGTIGDRLQAPIDNLMNCLQQIHKGNIAGTIISGWLGMITMAAAALKCYVYAYLFNNCLTIFGNVFYLVHLGGNHMEYLQFMPPYQMLGATLPGPDTSGIANAVNQLAFRNYTLNLNNGQTIFSVDGSIAT